MEQLRKEAIRRYLSGVSITIICKEFQISRKWFYKWLKRYESGKEFWYKDESKAPKTIPNKINKTMEQLILSIRDKLEKTKYAQKGVSAIAWQVQKLGHTPPPYWTINRILKRNGRIKTKPSKTVKKSNVSYPYFTEGCYPGHIHQADLIGPRYIKGDGRFYVFNTIDIFSHAVHSVSIRSKDDDSIIFALFNTWKELGIPEFLQIDNELCFRGSNKYPHSLGKVLKLCLSMNVQPVFIPSGEPWRNGVIERFNDTFEQKFYRTEKFINFSHLQNSLKNFLKFHNSHHIYSANGGKSPQQVLKSNSIKPNKLPSDYLLPKQLIIPDEGYIHIIRFIRSDLKLNIWSEIFSMPKNLMYQYVRATIFTEFHLLNVFLNDKLVAQFEYKLPTLNQIKPVKMLRELSSYINNFGINLT